MTMLNIAAIGSSSKGSALLSRILSGPIHPDVGVRTIEDGPTDLEIHVVLEGAHCLVLEASDEPPVYQDQLRRVFNNGHSVSCVLIVSSEAQLRLSHVAEYGKNVKYVVNTHPEEEVAEKSLEQARSDHAYLTSTFMWSGTSYLHENSPSKSLADLRQSIIRIACAELRAQAERICCAIN